MTTRTRKNKPGENCIEIIKTGFYDDTQNRNDIKIWWDDGGVGTMWNKRHLTF